MNSWPCELLVDSQSVLGEGPCWHAPSGRLLWVDIDAGVLNVYSPTTREHRRLIVGGHTSAVVATRSQGFLLAHNVGLARVQLEPFRVRALSGPLEANATMRLNEGKCDPAGRLWVGSMPFDFSPNGFLWSFETPGGWKRHLSGVAISNGLAWSADGRTLYFIDTPTGRIDAFQFEVETGTLSERREVYRVPKAEGGPDGMTIDAEGCLWVALWGGGRVIRLDPARGTRIGEISVPAMLVTSCVFGGAGLDVLYITTARGGLTPRQLQSQPLAGGVFLARPGMVGTPAVEFAD